MANLEKRCLMEKLFSALQSSPRGLTSTSATARLVVCGRNVFETKKQSKILAYLPLAVENAAVVAMAVGLARGGGDGTFFSALLVLLAADFVVCFAELYSAGESAACALVSRLAPSRRVFWVLRDGVWSGQDVATLVPGDIIPIRSGDVVPADARLLEKTAEWPLVTIKIDESALTGDPQPAPKDPGDAVYAGSVCAKGEAQAAVVAGGTYTYLANAVRLADATDSSQQTCRRVLGAFRAVWNACIVWACFAVLVDAVAGNVFRYDSNGVLLAGIMFVGMGFLVSDQCWEDPWEDRRRRQHRLANGGRDLEELMKKRLGALREQGKISEETVQRCHGLFGGEPVSDEMAATLANYLCGHSH